MERSERGRTAEAVVTEYLRAHGYVIVATNLRIGHLELDVVARLGCVIAVVEVRSRGSTAWTTAFGSIDGVKRRRIRRAGQRLWQRRYRHDETVERLRFDAAAVSWLAGQPVVEYVIGAF